MKNKNIPLKNYLILLVVFLGTIFVTLYLRSWYNASIEYYQNNSIMSEYLSELKSEEINSFIIDNPDIVIYYASAKDTTIKTFEKEFKKLMEKYEIKDEVVYIDSSKQENADFISKLNAVSDKKMKEINIPNLIYINEGKLGRVLYTSEEKINKRDVQNFLIKCGVITND